MEQKIQDYTKNKEFEIVEVEWFDAQSSLDPVRIDDLIEHPIVLTKSCGYLIKKDKQKVVLAFMIFGEDTMKHYQIIPMKMVKGIKRLKGVKK